MMSSSLLQGDHVSPLPAAAREPPSASREMARVRDNDQDEVLKMVERGEQSLMREAASQAYTLKQQYNRRGKIELGVVELSHLHSQLNSMTTQCTLIVGFALAGLGADTLTQIGDDESEFCIYKSPLSQAIGTAFILVSTACIFFSMTVIAVSTRWVLNQ